MRSPRHAQGLFAGMGVAGSLLAAVGAGFVLTGGLLAFQSWPSAGSQAQLPAALALSPALPAVITPAATLKLAAPITPRPAVPHALAAPAPPRVVTHRATVPQPTRPKVAGIVEGPGLAVTQTAASRSPVRRTAPLAPVADTVQAGATDTADSSRVVANHTARAVAAAPVVADTLTAAGAAVGGAVQQTGAAVAETVRDIGGS